MKRLHFVFSIFAALLVFMNCGANDKALAGPDDGFFDRKIEGEITVSAFDSMNYRSYLEEAARAFEALYPGTKVNIETFSAMPEVRTAEQGNMMLTSVQSQNDPQSRADYLNRINTNLMSGTGADIYALDILPLHKFAESGTLENLEPYMTLDPAFNKTDYRQNILDALRYRDGTWFLPVDYTFNYFAYDSTLIPLQVAAQFGVDKIWNTEDLFSLGIPLYDGTYRLFNAVDYPRGSGGMYSQLLNENIQFFVNLETGQAKFTDGGFSAILASVNNYAQSGYIPRGVSGQQEAGQVMRQGAGTPTDRFFFKLNSNASLIGQFFRGTGRMMRMGFSGNAPGIEDDDEIAGIQANADGMVPFNFNHSFGINSQSKNKETAWAFLKFLLSKEMQLSTNMNSAGLPVNNEARKEKAELTFSGTFSDRPGTMNAQLLQATGNYLAAVEALSDNINYFIVQDTSINDMIAQEVQYFFGGPRSAEETARVLQGKADLYLGE